MTDPMPRVTIAQIQRATAAHFGLPLEKMMCRRRYREFSRPRQIAMWIAHEQGKSLEQIGRSFGRDRTTVLAGVRRIEGILQGQSRRRLEGEFLARKIVEITRNLMD